MNFAHLHLLLNHWPIIGTFIGFGLYIASFVGSNKDLRRSSLIIFAGIAFLSIPTFLTGVAAQSWIKRNPVSTALMERHENAALLTLTLILMTGTFALAGLWQIYRDSRLASWNTTAILLFGILTVITLVRTGNTGGDISHLEVRDNPDATVMVSDGTFGSIVHVFEPSAAKFGNLMSYSKWCTAILMDLHFIGLALLIATVGVLDLRIMGFAKGIPIMAVHRFVPWGLLGLGINVVTGLMTFIGSPDSYNTSAPFWLKMGVLMLLGLNVIVFYLTGVFDHLESMGPNDDAPISAKFIATSSLILWIAVIVFGRYIQAYNHTIPLPPN
jgi:uncharacterized membrane protein